MDNAQTGMQARVNVKCPWLAILPLMLGSFVGMFSETSLNIALPQLMKALQVCLLSGLRPKSQFYLASLPLLLDR